MKKLNSVSFRCSRKWMENDKSTSMQKRKRPMRLHRIPIAKITLKRSERNAFISHICIFRICCELMLPRPTKWNCGRHTIQSGYHFATTILNVQFVSILRNLFSIPDNSKFLTSLLGFRQSTDRMIRINSVHLIILYLQPFNYPQKNPLVCHESEVLSEFFVIAE